MQRYWESETSAQPELRLGCYWKDLWEQLISSFAGNEQDREDMGETGRPGIQVHLSNDR